MESDTPVVSEFVKDDAPVPTVFDAIHPKEVEAALVAANVVWFAVYGKCVPEVR